MYKVEVEEIESKIKLIQKSKKDVFLPVFMAISGFTALGFAWGAPDEVFMIIFFSFIFLQSFALYYYILPLLGKIELIEQDIRKLKSATNVDDEKHY
jgi:hypothetical protein